MEELIIKAAKQTRQKFLYPKQEQYANITMKISKKLFCLFLKQGFCVKR